MRSLFLLSLAATVLSANMALANNPSNGDDHDRSKNYRMDCRFYDKHEGNGPDNCVSSATYSVHYGRNGIEFKNVRYGVRCDDQTIYNNEGVPFSTNQPDALTEDHIRPITSAVPKTKIFWQGALLTEGTYDADLELDEKILKKGSCDITTVRGRD
jgi:hypothetical protein